MEGKSPNFSFLIRMNEEAASRLPTQLLDDRRWITNGKWHGVSGLRRSKLKWSICNLRILEGSGFLGSWFSTPKSGGPDGDEDITDNFDIDKKTDSRSHRILFYISIDSPTLLICWINFSTFLVWSRKVSRPI